MFRNILLAVDGSEVSLRAARHGMGLAKSLKSNVTVVCVTLPWATYFSRELAVIVPDILIPEAEYEHKRHAKAAHLLREVEAEARSAGVPVKKVHSSHREPWRAIVDLAEHDRCDAIVMAPHSERGLMSLLVGSETMKVVTHASIPVLVYRET